MCADDDRRLATTAQHVPLAHRVQQRGAEQALVRQARNVARNGVGLEHAALRRLQRRHLQ